MVSLPTGIAMSKYEITQGQWKAVMGENESYFTGDNLPVEFVTYSEASEFCQKLTALESDSSRYSYRLPTRSEWMYACLAGTTTDFYTGNCIVAPLDRTALDANLSKAAWYSANADGHPHRVGTKAPNAFGLYDMHGNVAEWVNKDVSDAEGGLWVCGGSWQDPPSEAFANNILKIVSRDVHTRATPHIGFRIVKVHR
jgi:formylglycine-generating enzyme required for sulfatase activity